ncbi:MAG: type I-E CRISPR-associated protein Cas7/Cse4/CasC [Armatimonadetes bacterium]|nr:type I-E CRISPR-associated protein Cas7/Cse4/CasC [Armatimonadota bacterium]
MNIELHLIQNFAPSCLNRDDTNTPKTCYFGGVTRARISSQCFKRAMRLHMRDALGLPTGVRTRYLAGVPELLAARGYDLDEARQRTKDALVAAGFGMDGERTSVGLYLAHDEIATLAEAVAADWDSLQPADEPPAEKEAGVKGRGKGKGKSSGIAAPEVEAAVKALTNRVGSADIALYGRMIAENTNLNVDAACQVAQAISTHEVETEMDFFTAVDDLQPEEEPGAGMMGHQEFSSACFYRYALVQTGQLLANLEGNTELTRQTILAFVRAAIEAIPSARQNSHAAQNRPSFVQVVAGADLPVSLANAFERPIRPRPGESLVALSVESLLRHQQDLMSTYQLVGHGERRSLSVIAEHPGDGSDRELVDWVAGKLQEAV